MNAAEGCPLLPASRSPVNMPKPAFIKVAKATGRPMKNHQEHTVARWCPQSTAGSNAGQALAL